MWGGLPVHMLRFAPTIHVIICLHESVSSRARARLCRNRDQSAEPLETGHELRTLQVRDDPPHGRASFDLFCSPARPTRTGVLPAGGDRAWTCTFIQSMLTYWFVARFDWLCVPEFCVRKIAVPGESFLLYGLTLTRKINMFLF